MSSVTRGSAVVILDQTNDIKVLAELVANIAYEDLVDRVKNRSLLVTQRQFEMFIGKMGREMIDSGLLTKDLEPTKALRLGE